MVHWLPQAENTPTFIRYNSNDSTVKALTRSQVELHKLRTSHARLSAQSKHNELEWDQQRRTMENEMRQLQVRTDEAERSFNAHMADLNKTLQDREERMQQLHQQHSCLQDASTDTIQTLQDTLRNLESSCNDLQAESEQLKEKLKHAEVTEELKKRAEQRAAELESAIAATQEKAKKMIRGLDVQRQAAEAQRDELQQRLSSTEAGLHRQTELKQLSELDARRLAVESQRLSNALEIERIINAPLRHTTHASTTIAHVLRSAAAGAVTDHSTASPGQAWIEESGGPSSRWCADGSPNLAPAAARRPDGRHGLGESFADRNLTRLGRAWATTTPTAGLPHPTYLDNVERYRKRYMEAAAGGRRVAASPQAGSNRPTSAPPRRTTLIMESGPFLTPQKQKRPDRFPGSGSSSRTVKY